MRRYSFYWALQNLSLLADAAGWLLNILWPLLLGFCMAFVLNIPMRFFERHLLKNPKNKRAAALRRPLCILLAAGHHCYFDGGVRLGGAGAAECVRGAGRGHPRVFDGRAEVGAGRADRFPQAEQWLASLQIDWNETGKKLLSYVTEGAGNLLGGTVSVLSGIVGGVFNAIMAFIFALYILLGKEKLKSQTARVCGVSAAQMGGQPVLCGQYGQPHVCEIRFRPVHGGVHSGHAVLAGHVAAAAALCAHDRRAGGHYGAHSHRRRLGGPHCGRIHDRDGEPDAGADLRDFPAGAPAGGGQPHLSPCGRLLSWAAAHLGAGRRHGGRQPVGIAGMLFAVPVCSILHALLRLGVHRRLEAQAAAGASVPAPTPEEKM